MLVLNSLIPEKDQLTLEERLGKEIQRSTLTFQEIEFHELSYNNESFDEFKEQLIHCLVRPIEVDSRCMYMLYPRIRECLSKKWRLDSTI